MSLISWTDLAEGFFFSVQTCVSMYVCTGPHMDLCACIQVYVFACIGPRVFAPIWEGCREIAESSFMQLVVEPHGRQVGVPFCI